MAEQDGQDVRASQTQGADRHHASGTGKRKERTQGALKLLLIAVAVGVAGSIVVVPLTYLQIAATMAHVYLVALTLGLWVIPCVMPLSLVKTPGASLVACAAIGVVSALATPYGVSAIPALVLEGAIAEIPFLATLYRKWTLPQFYLSGALLGGFMGFMIPSAVGIVDAGLDLRLICMGIAVVSSLLGVWVARFASERIRRTGVLEQ